MTRRPIIVAATFALALAWHSAIAQDLTVADLRAKGATFLSAEELKAFLPGASLRYENSQFTTSLQLNADGSLVGQSERRTGSATTGTMSYVGEWQIRDGRWCGVNSRQGQELVKYCRDVLKLEAKYYYAAGNPKNDARRAFEMGVSR